MYFYKIHEYLDIKYKTYECTIMFHQFEVYTIQTTRKIDIFSVFTVDQAAICI